MARTHVSAILEQTFRRLHNSSNHLHAKSHIEMLEVVTSSQERPMCTRLPACLHIGNETNGDTESEIDL